LPHDVFISHASEDREQAMAAVDALERSGISCWIAPRDVQPGQPYAQAIINAINQARVMILVFSSRTNESKMVMRELERATGANKIVLPFRIEDVVPKQELEFYISREHWLNAFEPPFEGACDQLAAAVHNLLADPATNVGPTRPAAPAPVPAPARAAVAPPVPRPAGTQGGARSGSTVVTRTPAAEPAPATRRKGTGVLIAALAAVLVVGGGVGVWRFAGGNAAKLEELRRTAAVLNTPDDLPKAKAAVEELRKLKPDDPLIGMLEKNIRDKEVEQLRGTAGKVGTPAELAAAKQAVARLKELGAEVGDAQGKIDAAEKAAKVAELVGKVKAAEPETAAVDELARLDPANVEIAPARKRLDEAARRKQVDALAATAAKVGTAEEARAAARAIDELVGLSPNDPRVAELRAGVTRALAAELAGKLKVAVGAGAASEESDSAYTELSRIDPTNPAVGEYENKVIAKSGLVVGAQAKYKTIGAALLAAKEGQTISVMPGRYREEVKWPKVKGLRLLGRPGAVVEAQETSSFCIVVDGVNSGAIEGLAFDGRKVKGTKEDFDAILIVGGTQSPFKVESCTFTEFTGSGVLVAQAGTRAALTNLSTVGCGYGVYVSRGAGVTIDRCTFEDCTENGVGVTNPGSRAKVTGTTVRRAKGSGIRFVDTAGGSVEDCTVEDCAGHAVTASGEGTSPTVRKSRLRRCMSGVNFEAGAGGRVEETLAELHEKAGVLALGPGTSPVVVGSVLARNKLHGVVIFDGASGEVTGNTLEENEEDGVMVRGAGSKATVKENTARKNKVYGIVFDKGAIGTAEKNKVLENVKTGVYIADPGTKAEFANNQVADNGDFGIAVLDEAQATLRDNTVSGSGRSGILVTSKGQAVVVKNTVRENSSDGIIFRGESRGSIDDNTCERNSDTGITLAELSKPVVRRNRSAFNGRHGVYISDGAGELVEANTIEKNSDTGIVVTGKGSNPTLRGNRSQNNKFSGLWVTKEANPKVEGDNTFKGNEQGDVKDERL
jgi:parallel beta-helix repeat protein